MLVEVEVCADCLERWLDLLLLPLPRLSSFVQVLPLISCLPDKAT